MKWRQAMFDWNLLITALTGLGGVAVGGFVTWKIQERQLKHIDENRFQEQRMAVYQDFITAANVLIAKYSVGHTHEIDGYAEKFMNVFQKIHLVASDETLEQASYLFRMVRDMQDNNALAADVKVIKKYNDMSGQFMRKARKELKIEI